MNEGLAEWFKEELKLRRLAQKLQQLVQREFTLGEFILPVLREINYLSNTEFRDLELKIKGPVSYTHLDVYKRQHWRISPSCV